MLTNTYIQIKFFASSITLQMDLKKDDYAQQKLWQPLLEWFVNQEHSWNHKSICMSLAVDIYQLDASIWYADDRGRLIILIIIYNYTYITNNDSIRVIDHYHTKMYRSLLKLVISFSANKLMLPGANLVVMIWLEI